MYKSIDRMSYSTNVFSTWASHGTWDALKTWLQSKEGGSLRIVEPKEGDFVLIRYTKGVSDFTKEHVRWCRSVVFNKNTLLVVSVAPSKANEISETSTYTVAEEFVDGTMINIFRDATLNVVDVATRSRLGGKNQFYTGGPTFRSMLEDTLKSQTLSMADLLPTATDTNSFVSIVLQHPENRVVKNVTSSCVFVVHQGTVSADNVVTFVESSLSVPDANKLPQYNLEAVLTAPNLQQWVIDQSKERGYEWQGLVLKDGKGGRWRIRSEVYETVRRLRGNEASIEERFARLRKMRTLEQYLNFYSADRQVLYDLEGVFRENTRRLQNLYVSTFITRTEPFHELPWPFKHHVSVLHNLYKDVLRPHGKKMNMEEVVRYANRLDFKDTANLCKKFIASTTKSKLQLAVPAATTPGAVSDAVPDAIDAEVLDDEALDAEVPDDEVPDAEASTA